MPGGLPVVVGSSDRSCCWDREWCCYQRGLCLSWQGWLVGGSSEEVSDGGMVVCTEWMGLLSPLVEQGWVLLVPAVLGCEDTNVGREYED